MVAVNKIKVPATSVMDNFFILMVPLCISVGLRF